MLSKCLNSLCSARFRRLGNGRLFRIDFSEAAKRNPMLGAAPNYVQPTHAMEHFWLCGPCSSAFEFVFESDGSVGLKHRHDEQAAMTAA